uniref:SH3 domain-containing protein n=1 Tax=Strongyloides venezuelensis TaxID=75913 RepID=A0A0K0G073_STRVS
MENETDAISTSSSTSSSVTPNEKCVHFPRIRKLLKRFTSRKHHNVIDSININFKNTKNTIFVVIENYKALSQSHISVNKGQKVILLGNSSANDENVNVALLPSENFLSPSNDTGIQGIIPMRILACIENENKG